LYYTTRLIQTGHGIKVIKGGILLITGSLLASMIATIEGWEIYTTPISMLGVHPATRRFFGYFITLQTLILGALYKRINVKPLLVFIGLASLCLISIYDMHYFPKTHNLFAVVFFLCQPALFYLQYRNKKDPWGLLKMSIFLLMMYATYTGDIPLPVFEFFAYVLLIIFL